MLTVDTFGINSVCIDTKDIVVNIQNRLTSLTNIQDIRKMLTENIFDIRREVSILVVVNYKPGRFLLYSICTYSLHSFNGDASYKKRTLK